MSTVVASAGTHPTRAGEQFDAVIVGAGILGCALAWRMAARGVCAGERIVVLDPNALASQATGRAAALLSVARSAGKEHWIALVRRTLAAVDELAAAGLPVPLRHSGALHLAAAEAGSAVLADLEDTAARHGIDCRRVAATDFAARLPWLDLEGFRSALWFPTEVYTDPYLLAGAYAAAARRLGVRFVRAAAKLGAQGDHVSVEWAGARICPQWCWVAAGAWSQRLLGALGATAPQAAVRSQYWISAPTALARADMPMLLAPDLRLYARPELGSILFGLREQDGVAMASDRLPGDLAGFVFDAADPDGYATLEAFAPMLARHAPGLVQAGLRHYVTGPSCYTPDGEFVLGAAPPWRNLYLLTGCNGAGIAASCGLAERAVDVMDANGADADARFSPTRFGPIDADSPQWLARCVAARAGKTSG